MSESASTPAYQSVSLTRTESNMVHRTASNRSRKGAKKSRKVCRILFAFFAIFA